MYDIKRWPTKVIQAVWEKGHIVANNDPAIFRKDACGAWMQFSQHGNRKAKYGWEIDHILPESQHGTDALENLQPLHWENNAAKGDSQILRCAITS